MHIEGGGQSRLVRGGWLLLVRMYVCDCMSRLVVCVLKRRRRMQEFVLGSVPQKQEEYLHFLHRRSIIGDPDAS